MNDVAYFTLAPAAEGFTIAPASAVDGALICRLLGADALSRAWPAPYPSALDALREAGSALFVEPLGGYPHRLRLYPEDPFPDWAEVEPLPNPFGDLVRDYAASWGISDLYEENRARLEAALAAGEPFDTGWFGAKKEIESARLVRAYVGAPVTVEVSSQMDDDFDLADTAFWSAAGGNEAGSCGADVLGKIGLDEEAIDTELANLVDYWGLGEDNSAIRREALAPDAGIEAAIEALERLAGDCDVELEQLFEALKAFAGLRLEALREERQATPD
ncbi:hypothetical protein [Geopseudomonas aromaticivorans]